MICHTCGREIDDDSIFCTFCGADQRGADQDAAREGDTAAFPLSKALTRHGDRFEIRISKPFWVGLLGFLNAALIFPCVMLISMVLQIFSADPEERAFAADISWSFIPLIFLLLWMLLPMVRMLRQAIRLPAEGGKIRFAATEIESIVVNRIWYRYFIIFVEIRSGSSTVEAPLGIRTADTREQAEEVVRRLQEFFGRQIAVRWVNLSQLRRRRRHR